MTCPHCQTALPANYAASWCPHCGKNLIPSPLTADLPPAIEATGTPVSWWLFWCVLLAPAVFAIVGSLTNIEELAITSPLFGGAIAGLICGVMVANSLKQPQGTRIAMGFVFVPLFAILSFALGFGGCMLGGGIALNFH